MSEGFARTLQTASEAEANARLLERAAEKRLTYLEVERLRLLAERYRDYAASLRSMVAQGQEPAEPEPDQVALL
jgi:hypothetical protein